MTSADETYENGIPVAALTFLSVTLTTSIPPTINTPNVVDVSPNGVTDSTGVYYGGGGLGALSPAGAGMFDDFSGSFFG